MYQLAWTEFKRSRYDDATRLFVQLLDDSEAGRKAGRKASEYAKDAITYLALSLSDRADSEGVQQDGEPLDGDLFALRICSVSVVQVAGEQLDVTTWSPDAGLQVLTAG